MKQQSPGPFPLVVQTVSAIDSGPWDEAPQSYQIQRLREVVKYLLRRLETLELETVVLRKTVVEHTLAFVPPRPDGEERPRVLRELGGF